MSQLLEVQINENLLTEAKKYKGAKGNYIKLTISINDETDQFGNDVSAYEQQSKDERENKTKKNFVGNGKTFWANGGAKTAAEKGGKAGGETKAPESKAPDLDDDLPF